MMKALIRATVIGIGVGVLIGLMLGYVLRASDGQLSEVHRLKAVNYRLEAHNLTLQCQAAGLTLEKKRDRLEQEFRAAVQPAPGSVFDWETLTFVSPKKPQGDQP